MSPIDFKEANTQIGKPEDLDESQCASIPGHVFTIQGGNLDGSKAIVVAWEPSPEERAEILAGSHIYITFLGGIVGHTVQTSFDHACSISS